MLQLVFQSLGLSSLFGVDHKRQKHAGKILVADLTSQSRQELCWSWVKSPSCMGVFCAPPCGTCSRARGIPIKLANGVKIAGPQPLRTDQQPDGVKYMSYVNKIRVSQANILYKFVTDVALFCIDAGMIVAIENPRSSLYWKTSFFAPLRKYLKFTEHQACAYGSERPKWTALAHNTVALTKLCKCCPGVSSQHKHKPWGMVTGPDATRKFSTAEETAYSMPLAYAIAFHLAQELMSRGWQPPAIEFATPDNVSYHYLGQQLQAEWNGIPPGSRLLTIPPLRLKGGTELVGARSNYPLLPVPARVKLNPCSLVFTSRVNSLSRMPLKLATRLANRPSCQLPCRKLLISFPQTPFTRLPSAAMTLSGFLVI